MPVGACNILPESFTLRFGPHDKKSHLVDASLHLNGFSVLVHDEGSHPKMKEQNFRITELTEITNFFGISTTVFDNFWMEASHWGKKLRGTGLFMRYAFLSWSTVSRLQPQGCCCRSQTCLCVELLVDRQLGKHSDRPESLFFPTRDTWDTRFNLQRVRLKMSTWFKFAEMLPSVWLLCYLSRPLLAWLKLARAVWTEWMWMCLQFLTIPRIDLFKPHAGFTCIFPAALVFNQCDGCLRMVVIFIFKWLGFETYITDVSNMLSILIREHNNHSLDNFENFIAA